MIQGYLSSCICHTKWSKTSTVSLEWIINNCQDFALKEILPVLFTSHLFKSSSWPLWPTQVLIPCAMKKIKTKTSHFIDLFNICCKNTVSQCTHFEDKQIRSWNNVYSPAVKTPRKRRSVKSILGEILNLPLNFNGKLALRLDTICVVCQCNNMHNCLLLHYKF